MLEDFVIDDGDVEGWEHGDEACEHAPEKKLITPNIVSPLREIPFRVWPHLEERAAHVHDLPSQEQREPRQTREGGSTGAKYGVAGLRVGVVASLAEFTVREAKHDEAEGAEAED